MPHPRFGHADTNRYQAHLYDALALHGVEVLRFDRKVLRRGDADILHIHWPEYYAGGRTARVRFRRYMAVLSDLLAVRLRKTAVVWTAHNLEPHDWQNRRHERYFWYVFRRRLDGILFLSSASRTLAFDRHPELVAIPNRVTPHGVYSELDQVPNKHDARRQLRLPQHAQLALVIGAIRRYKRCASLLQRFRDESRPSLHLVIAGETWEGDVHDELVSLADGHDHIHLRLQFLPDDDFASYIAAADIVIIGQQAVLNSGAAMAALSAGRPVLMSESPSARELQDAVGSEWVGIAPDLPGPSFARTFLVQRTAHAPLLRPKLARFQWEHIAEATRSLYDDARQHARYRRHLW